MVKCFYCKKDVLEGTLFWDLCAHSFYIYESGCFEIIDVITKNKNFYAKTTIFAKIKKYEKKDL